MFISGDGGPADRQLRTEAAGLTADSFLLRRIMTEASRGGPWTTDLEETSALTSLFLSDWTDVTSAPPEAPPDPRSSVWTGAWPAPAVGHVISSDSLQPRFMSCKPAAPNHRW